MNPDAAYDTLKIVSQLTRPLAGASRGDLQKLAFLSCMLALFRGRPVADWGYRFARTSFGTPFSSEINDALDALKRSGRVVETDGRYTLSESGEQLLTTMALLGTCQIRDVYLDAACSSTLAVPPGVLTKALAEEPTVLSSSYRVQGATLLEGPAVQLLHEHFKGLAMCLGDSADGLLTPSVLWLSYAAGESLSHKTGASTVHA